MLDQLTIGNKHSLDYGASVAFREIEQPAKKTIKETVPFSNVTYDFSVINGELYWEERKLQYTFEIIADTPAELEEMKAAFASWIMNVFGENLYDPFIENYHFVATFSDMTFADEESEEKTTATVTFTAYPYKIANEAKVFKQSIAAGETVTLMVVNNSSHRLTPTIIVDGSVKIQFNGNTYALAAGQYEDDEIKVAVGNNSFAVENTGNATCSIEINFFEEVF